MNLMLHVHALGSLKSALLLVGALNVLECRLIAKYSDDTKSSDLSLDTPPHLQVYDDVNLWIVYYVPILDLSDFS